MQHVLSAGGGPKSQQLMMSVGEPPAAMDRHHAGVADPGKDHADSLPACGSPYVRARRFSNNDPSPALEDGCSSARGDLDSMRDLEDVAVRIADHYPSVAVGRVQWRFERFGPGRDRATV